MNLPGMFADVTPGELLFFTIVFVVFLIGIYAAEIAREN